MIRVTVSEKVRGICRDSICRPRSLTDCSYSSLSSKFSFFAFSFFAIFIFCIFHFVILKWRDRVLTHVPFRQTMIYHHWGFLSQARRATACIQMKTVQSTFFSSRWFRQKSPVDGFRHEYGFRRFPVRFERKFRFKIQLGPHLVLQSVYDL